MPVTARSRRGCTRAARRCPCPADIHQGVRHVYAYYALQLFAIPEKFISDHHERPADAPLKLLVFFVRGSGLMIAGVAYAMYKLDVPLKLLVAFNAMVGLVYPWNAAYISKLPVKYPMHAMPEVLMAGLTVAGVLAL